MVVVIAGVLYVAGSNIGSGWVIILTAAMVGALALDLWSVWRTHRATQVVLTPATTATTTVPIALRAMIHRPDLGTSLQLSTQAGTARSVVRRSDTTVVALLDVARGHHREVPAVARTIGALGLAHATRSLTGAAELWCRPGVLAAHARMRALVGAQSQILPSPARRGEENVRGVREFTSTDPRRAVHWRATARQGRLMVRELDDAQGAQVRLGIAGGTWTTHALDLACEVLASLAAAAAEMGHPSEILVDGAVHPWDDQTWHLLAALPPAVGIPARPLAGQATDDATLWLRPAATGVIAGGDLLTDRDEVVRWLRTDA